MESLMPDAAGHRRAPVTVAGRLRLWRESEAMGLGRGLVVSSRF